MVANEIGLVWCQSSSKCPSPSAKFYDAQANFVVRTLARASGNGVQGFAWYPLEWHGFRYSSLLYQNGDPKPIYTAYQQLAEQLAQATYLRTVEYGTGIEAYTFGRTTKQGQVIWTIDVTMRTISIPQSQLLRAVDRDGQPIVPIVEGADSHLAIGFAPIYVIIRHLDLLQCGVFQMS